MKSMKVREFLTAIEGKLIVNGDADEVSRVCQDSRKAIDGDVFFAIRGDNTDGHLYIEKAVEKGCSYVVLEDVSRCDISSLEKKGVGCIEVDNSLQALGRLARYYLKSIDAKVVGITGSTGKTTTRDILYTISSEKYKSHKNEGNYNSAIGVPLTILDMPQDTQVAIIEMGMDRKGEIDFISAIMEPDICIITNIGVSHMERLGGKKGIFEAKLECVENFREDGAGTLLVFEDDEFLNKKSLQAYKRSLKDKGVNWKNTLIVGEKAHKYGGENFLIGGYKARGEGSEFAMEDIRGGYIGIYDLNLKGWHNCKNASLAVCAGELLGVEREKISKALMKIKVTRGRLENIQIGEIILIDDTYNASPDSMKAALDVIADVKCNRKIAVLGDMYETGREEEKYHREIGAYAKEKADMLITFGELGKCISNENNFQEKSRLVKYLSEEIRGGDAVLFKASRGVKLDEVVSEISNILRDRGNYGI